MALTATFESVYFRVLVVAVPYFVHTQRPHESSYADLVKLKEFEEDSERIDPGTYSKTFLSDSDCDNLENKESTSDR